VFSNRQVFLEHFSLPQAGSVANIQESIPQHREINGKHWSRP
jgi:hypothetical protein